MSDQDPYTSLIKLLQEYDLSPDKWLPVFHHKGITKKDDLTENKGSDELFESLLTNADMEKEKRGLRKLLEIHKVTHCSADSEIERELAVSGLQPTASWLSIFKTQLGVRTPQGLEHIGSESYADLKRFAQKPWEKKALRKLLGMDDEETTMNLLRMKQKQKLQQREQKSQKMLEELKDLQKQGKECHDETTRQLLDCVQEALQIPEGSCIVKDPSLDALITNLQMDIDQVHGELKTSMDLSDVEVLQHSSSGCVLQGILVSRNLDDQFEIRENLLSIPQDAQLKPPSLCQDDKIVVFSSQYQEHQFTSSMDRLGYSVTASLKTGFLGFGGQMSASYAKDTEKERISKYHQKEAYYSTIKYSFMPMASFHFKGSQLQLSVDALKGLQAIEVFHGSQNALQKQCEHFFCKYGSHANKGPIHFGGVYWLKCYTCDFLKSDLDEVKRLQNQAVSASVSLSYGGFGASVEGNVSKLKPNLKGNFSEELMSSTIVEVRRKGGLQAASNIPIWKSGLVANNSTWNVIDRGSITVPIWEIIQVQSF